MTDGAPTGAPPRDRWRRLARSSAVGAAGGVLAALSLPPFGWWWSAWIGFALLAVALAGEGWRSRFAAGWSFGAGQFAVGLWWMREFSLPGTVLVVLLEAAFLGSAAVAVHPRRVAVLPAAVVAVEAVRGAWPFGGLPLAGVALGQISGPLGGGARVGGALLLVGSAAAVGTGAAAVAARRPRAAAVLLGGVVVVAGVSAVAPDGGPGRGTIDAVAVQGGGPRGLRAVDTDPAATLDRHLAATESVEPGHDLVLWPEDVVDVGGPIDRTEEGRMLATLADALDATFVAGVVQDVDRGRFANEAVAWDSEGTIVDRYEKVHRVPFGEYVPFRSLVGRVADISAVPRDARPGTGPGILRTPAGHLGVLISYEVFFADRGRAAVGAGAEVLLVPTNAASFTDSQVPTQQVAAARLRAVETGRDLLQVGPTGYTAVVDNRGRLLARSTLGERAVTEAALQRRTGRTVHARFGEAWLVVLALLGAAQAWSGRSWFRQPRTRPDRSGTDR